MGNLKLEPKELLPTWDDIFKQIEYFRGQANKYYQFIDKEYNNNCPKIKEKNVNNILYNPSDFYNNISIIGGRGTGKTSILFEIKNKISKDEECKYSKDEECKYSKDDKCNHNKDILFDIITPDIRDKEDIFGWIISLVIKKSKQIIEEKEKSNKREDYCEICDNDKEINKAIKKLEQAYFFRKSMYENVIVNDYSSKIDYLRDNVEKLNADVDIKSTFSDVIDCIVELKGKEYNPLLVFLFDDIDIHSSKASEILSCIMNYLSHPNIVNIIALDYKSAIENITIKMLQEDNVCNENFIKLNLINEINIEDTVLKMRMERSYNMLKKVLPPAYRHYIKILTNEAKYENMKNIFIKKDNDSVNCVGENTRRILDNIENFINFENCKRPLYDYMSFLDNTVRGYTNVIKFIQSRNIDEILDINNQAKEGNKIKKLEYLRSLLEVIIESNSDLEKSKDLIYKVIDLSTNTNIEFINYQIIMNEINKEKNEILIKYKFESYYKLFILASFFEKLIIEFGLRENTNLHGIEVLVNIINLLRIKEPITLVPNFKKNTYDSDEVCDIQKIISIKQNLFNTLKYDEIQQLFEYENYGYLEKVYIEDLTYREKSNLADVIDYIFDVSKIDRLWANGMIDWITGININSKKLRENIINDLETEYKYGIDISVINIKNIKNKKKEYKSSLKNILETENILDLNFVIKTINECIDKKDNYESLVFRIADIDDQILYCQDLERDYGEQIDEIKKYDLDNKKDDYKNKFKNEIITIIKENEKFIDDKLNREVWNKLKDKVIIYDKKEENKLLDLVGIKIELNIKERLESLLYNKDDKYIKNLNFKDVIIKDDLNINDDSEILFIKKYCQSVEIVKILKQHPIILEEPIEKDLKDVKYSIERYSQEKKNLESEKQYILISLVDNIIINSIIQDRLNLKQDNLIYPSTIQNMIRNGEINIEILINSIFKTKEINYKLYELIDYLLWFCNEEKEKNKLITFKGLLDMFFYEIRMYKDTDNKIIEILNSEELKSEYKEIKEYENKLNKINSTINLYDLDLLRNKIEKIFTGSKAERNIRLIFSKKRREIDDEDIKLKVFRYGFNTTLGKYIDLKEEELKNNQTSVSIDLYKELENKVKEFGNEIENYSFIRYIESKLNE